MGSSFVIIFIPEPIDQLVPRPIIFGNASGVHPQKKHNNKWKLAARSSQVAIEGKRRGRGRGRGSRAATTKTKSAVGYQRVADAYLHQCNTQTTTELLLSKVVKQEQQQRRRKQTLTQRAQCWQFSLFPLLLLLQEGETELHSLDSLAWKMLQQWVTDCAGNSHFV